MAVEPYLDMCSLFPVGRGVELFAHLNEPLIDKIGELTSEQYYLRFVNKPLNNRMPAWGSAFVNRCCGGLVSGDTSRKELLNRAVMTSIIIKTTPAYRE